MNRIAGRITTWLAGREQMARARVRRVRIGKGFAVADIQDLIVRVAHLSFFNQSLQLFFRWQNEDYRNGTKAAASRPSTILPSILRGPRREVGLRFEKLARAEDEIRKLDCFGRQARWLVRRRPVVRWALIQHYKIAETPLLDVTHSLRVACSFASGRGDEKESFLYVLGIPHTRGRNTTFRDHGIKAVRLLSMCPPLARGSKDIRVQQCRPPAASPPTVARIRP